MSYWSVLINHSRQKTATTWKILGTSQNSVFKRTHFGEIMRWEGSLCGTPHKVTGHQQTVPLDRTLVNHYQVTGGWSTQKEIINTFAIHNVT